MPRSKLLRSPYPNGGIQVSKSWYSLGPKITALGRLCTQTNTNAKLGKCPCSSAASVAYPLEFFSAPLFSLLPPHPSAHSLPPPFPCWAAGGWRSSRHDRTSPPPSSTSSSPLGFATPGSGGASGTRARSGFPPPPCHGCLPARRPPPPDHGGRNLLRSH
jgi:hypothetical protein